LIEEKPIETAIPNSIRDSLNYEGFGRQEQREANDLVSLIDKERLMGTFGDDEESDCSDEVREICR